MEEHVGSTLIRRKDSFLLVKSNKGVARGLWDIPGGCCEGDETYTEAAKRETLEKTGFMVLTDRLIATFHFREYSGKKVIRKVFEGMIVGGEKPDPVKKYIKDLKWFRCEDMTPKELFTFTAWRSVLDAVSLKLNQVYYPKEIA